MTFRANKAGTWVGGDDQSAGTTVYGKLGADWLYAKAVFANKNGTWERAWTDCRKYDAGGRDWSSSSQVFTDATGCDSCGTKSKTVVTYTKTGCPNDVRDPGYGACSDSWVAATASTIDTGGVTYYNTGPGNYFTFNDPCITCTGGGCEVATGDYYITTCGTTGAYRITQVGCSCINIC
jgi:hypothetical protein